MVFICYKNIPNPKRGAAFLYIVAAPPITFFFFNLLIIIFYFSHFIIFMNLSILLSHLYMITSNMSLLFNLYMSIRKNKIK